jgi:hypothetical protein
MAMLAASAVVSADPMLYTFSGTVLYVYADVYDPITLEPSQLMNPDGVAAGDAVTYVFEVDTDVDAYGISSPGADPDIYPESPGIDKFYSRLVSGKLFDEHGNPVGSESFLGCSLAPYFGAGCTLSHTWGGHWVALMATNDVPSLDLAVPGVTSFSAEEYLLAPVGNGTNLWDRYDAVANLTLMSVEPVSAAVPEPGMLSLLGLGFCSLLGVGALRRRR